MWLSRQMKPEVQTVDADLGVTTIAGDSVGVVTRGEVRALPVYGPGGYVWLPENGATVLVVKGGPGGQEQCVAGARAEAVPQEYDIRGLQISKTNHKCFLFGEELSLTPLEFSILWHLCSRQGQVVSSEELFEAAWGEKYLDSNNTVMSHIARLREKMHENSRRPKFIKTVWGVGYTIE